MLVCGVCAYVLHHTAVADSNATSSRLQPPSAPAGRHDTPIACAFLFAIALVLCKPDVPPALVLCVPHLLWALAAWFVLKTVLLCIPGLGMPADNDKWTWIAYDHFRPEEILEMKKMRSVSPFARLLPLRRARN